MKYTDTPRELRYCVIMCGGVGSRFWPFSRTEMPKQFIDFFGTGRSLLQMTFDRIRPLVDAGNILLVTNEAYRGIVSEQLPEVPPANILCEPARRNTAPCICWSASHIAARNPDAVIVTLPADHLVLREEAFLEAVGESIGFATGRDALLTIGLKPTSPHTGYGYIQRGAPVEGFPGICRVKSFTEKPELRMAELFLRTGEFFWNSGMFIWSASSILKAFREYAPETLDIFSRGKGLYGTPEESGFIRSCFPAAPAISIDYAVMEKASNVYVKTADLGWSDLGSWKSLHDVSPKTREGNVTQNCKVLAPGCEGSVFAASGDKIIVAAGLKDYIVADNGDALLIYPIADEQKIRTIVNDVATLFGDKYV